MTRNNIIIIIIDIWYIAFSTYNVQKRFMKNSQWTYLYGPPSQINSFPKSNVSAVSWVDSYIMNDSSFSNSQDTY